MRLLLWSLATAAAGTILIAQQSLYPTPAATGFGQTFAVSVSSGGSATLAHNFGTMNLVIDCRDSASPAHEVKPGLIAYLDVNRVTLSFPVGFTGSCFVR